MSSRPRRSLLDDVDVAALRRQASERTGIFAGVVAALMDTGVVQHDPDDPGWSDRDRLVAGGPEAARPFLLGEPVLRCEAGTALRQAVDAGVASTSGGGIYRVWCLLDPGAAEHGGTWEAARAAADAGCAEITAVCPSGLLADLLVLAGWRRVPSVGDPLSVFAALDRALAHRGGPSVVVLS